MTRSAAYRGPAFLLIGLPLAVAAVWLLPTATRWMAGGDKDAPASAAHANAPSAGNATQRAVGPLQAGAARVTAALPPEALLPKWEQDVHSRDPAVRADALAGLATAPREQALAILQGLLKDGAYPDRQMVIESLAILARLQGDADERIRTAFRVEIYDGSDEATSRSAQLALADLEEDLR